MSSSLPASLVDVHRRNNRATAAAWEVFAPHREALTALVRAVTAGSSPGSLLVLGAGNCNDLDLAAVSPEVSAIHLADVDPSALDRARARQPEHVRRRLALHAPVDLGGALRKLAAWGAGRPTPAQIERLPETIADQVVSALPGGHGTVLSACLLTQLLHGARTALGVGHPDLRAVAGGLVAGHLRAMASLLAPGGTGLLATDVVSSETYPLVELWGEREPRALLDELSATDNCFTGADPRFLMRMLREHPAVAPHIEMPEIALPWLWPMSAEVTLLVYGLRFRRRS